MDTISNITPSPVTPNQPDKESNIKSLKNGLSIFSASRCGIYHEFNEDRILFDEHGSFYGLADGVGGGALGDKAAETLLQYLKSQSKEVPTADEIVSYLKQSDKIVRDELAKFNARGASTVVCAWLDKNGIGRYSCVGDARIYLITVNNENQVILEQITIDQTYGNLNAEPPTGGSYDDPARMIGVGAVGSPPVNEIILQHNQGLLFCSDGVHKFVSTEEMQEICTDYLTLSGKNYYQINAVADILVNRAKNNYSHDDCSVMIVLNYQKNSKQEESPQKTIPSSCTTKIPIQQISNQQNKESIAINLEKPCTKINPFPLKLFGVVLLVVLVLGFVFLFDTKFKQNSSQPKTVAIQPNNQISLLEINKANYFIIDTDKTQQKEIELTTNIPKFEGGNSTHYNLSNLSTTAVVNFQPTLQLSIPNFQQSEVMKNVSVMPNQLNNYETTKLTNSLYSRYPTITKINTNSNNTNLQEIIVILKKNNQEYIENTTNKELFQPIIKE